MVIPYAHQVGLLETTLRAKEDAQVCISHWYHPYGKVGIFLTRGVSKISANQKFYARPIVQHVLSVHWLRLKNAVESLCLQGMARS